MFPEDEADLFCQANSPILGGQKEQDTVRSHFSPFLGARCLLVYTFCMAELSRTVSPDSPRIEGFDLDGFPVSLGGYSSDGSFVGYISEDGTDWESREDYEIAYAAGVLYDAFIQWNRTGGALGPEPDIQSLLSSCEVEPEGHEAAIALYYKMLGMLRLFAPLTTAIQALNN
jgi:hypothetical protein